MALFVGLMSGTSLDGVDGVLAEFGPRALRPRSVRAHAHVELPGALADELLALNRSGDDELHRSALAANALMSVYAQVVAELLERAGCSADEVRALGAHGQTVRHRPQHGGGTGYTLQLANGALLAELTGITTVCDFRAADVAAGGQGAPLVPAFHGACFAQSGVDVAVLNVGGMANLTLLPAARVVRGFDTGPGNALLDLWCRRAWGRAFDDGGRLAAAGQVQPQRLHRLLDEPYFARRPPKSTGRDLFDVDWLQGRWPDLDAGNRPQDVMATLAELTARTVADALLAEMPGVRRLLVCGGGAFNEHLLARWRSLLPGTEVCTSAAAGMPPDQVEALAFAWLAACRLHGRAASLPAVTGARGPRVLGAVYPAPARPQPDRTIRP